MTARIKRILSCLLSLVMPLLSRIKRTPLLLAVLILPGGCFLLPPLTVMLERQKNKIV
jgi:hypothetical protein